MTARTATASQGIWPTTPGCSPGGQRERSRLWASRASKPTSAGAGPLEGDAPPVVPQAGRRVVAEPLDQAPVPPPTGKGLHEHHPRRQQNGKSGGDDEHPIDGTEVGSRRRITHPSRLVEDGHNGPVTRVRAEVFVGLLILGSLTLWAAEAAPAPAPCGAPDQAPGFETPAQRRVIPDVVCMDLQLAQDKAQAAGFYRLESQDSSGQRRRQVDDQNWVVVSQTPPAGTRPGRSPRLVFEVLAYGDPGAPPVPNRSRPGRMPQLRCFDLQEAQDTLQSAGFLRTRSEDATGRGRRQYIDRNWIVTDQSPPPGGTHPKNTQVTLRVVKDREPSPC